MLHNVKNQNNDKFKINNINNSETQENDKPKLKNKRPSFTIYMVKEIILTILIAIAISCIRELTATTAAIHTIRIQENSKPFKIRQRQIPCKYQEVLERILDDMLTAGIIQ
jgi:hypothetical protein